MESSVQSMMILTSLCVLDVAWQDVLISLNMTHIIAIRTALNSLGASWRSHPMKYLTSYYTAEQGLVSMS